MTERANHYWPKRSPRSVIDKTVGIIEERKPITEKQLYEGVADFYASSLGENWYINYEMFGEYITATLDNGKEVSFTFTTDSRAIIHIIEGSVFNESYMLRETSEGEIETLGRVNSLKFGVMPQGLSEDLKTRIYFGIFNGLTHVSPVPSSS